MEGKDSPYGVENTNQAFWLTPLGHITRLGVLEHTVCSAAASEAVGPRGHVLHEPVPGRIATATAPHAPGAAQLRRGEQRRGAVEQGGAGSR